MVKTSKSKVNPRILTPIIGNRIFRVGWSVSNTLSRPGTVRAETRWVARSTCQLGSGVMVMSESVTATTPPVNTTGQRRADHADVHLLSMRDHPQ